MYIHTYTYIIHIHVRIYVYVGLENWGHYKSWTLDSGLDHGLDYGPMIYWS